MSDSFTLDGKEYDAASLSEKAQRLLQSYLTVDQQLHEAQNMQAVLTKARNAYIADLRNEMMRGKTGIDLSTLFSD